VAENDNVKRVQIWPFQLICRGTCVSGIYVFKESANEVSPYTMVQEHLKKHQLCGIQIKVVIWYIRDKAVLKLS
jgi:hypothetical protein